MSATTPRDLVIPGDVLARAGLDAGDNVVFEVEEGGVRVVPDRLRKVYVETTTRCNLDCAMCVRQAWRNDPGDMPLERYKRLLDGLPAGDPARLTLAFGGFGEPLVHPSWLDFVRDARARQHGVELITNGLALNDEAAGSLVELGVAQVTVSIDGGDEASYRRMRGTAREAATLAVERLLRARLHSRSRMQVGVAAVAMRSTVGSLPALVAWATDRQLDFVSISNVVPHTEALAVETLWDRAGWASVFFPAAWRPSLRVARLDAEAVTRPLAEAVWPRGLTFPPPSADEGAWRNHCRFVHEGMCAVASDGRVAPCLSLLHGHTEHVNTQTRRVEAHVVGHIDQAPLAGIWKDAGYREYRRRVRTFDFPPCFHCGGCPLTESNAEDCYRNPAPVCGECLWAQGLVLCP